jgi:hypothetical protein
MSIAFRRKPPAEALRSWAFFLSFPLTIALLVYIRAHFGYGSQSIQRIGLLLFALGIVELLCNIFVPWLLHGASSVLRQQSIYSDIWAALAGIWLYWGLWKDFGLAILIVIGLSLWPLSYRELLRLRAS